MLNAYRIPEFSYCYWLGFAMNAYFIHVISGFTQHAGYFHGILHLREMLIDAGHNNGRRRRVEYSTWEADAHRLAVELSMVSNRLGCRPKVGIASYSYGGWKSLKFCQELDRIGIDVDFLVISDPVGRSSWWPEPLPAATSLLGRDYAFSLSVPPRVKRVVEFYQKKNRPQGHRLKINETTTLLESHELQYRHQRMDDSPEFHQAVLDEASFFLSED